MVLVLWWSSSGNNWETIDHPGYEISFKVPVTWDVGTLESGRERISGSFNGGDTMVYLDINLITTNNPSQQNLFNRALPFAGEKIKQGGLIGVLYAGKVIDEGGGEEWPTQENGGAGQNAPEIKFLENSYFQERTFIVDSGIIDTKCITLGPDYKSYISVCNDILSSVKHI